MANVGELSVNLVARSAGFAAGLKGAQGSMQGFASKALNLGKSVVSAIAPISGAVALVDLVRQADNFNSVMTNSTAIMGPLSDAMRGNMVQAALEVASATKFSAKDAAESYFFLASAGLDAAQSIAALPAVAAFAQAGNFDLARATDLVTDAQSALGLASKDAQQNLLSMQRVSDVLVKANVLANASVEQFSEALTNKAGAAMKVLGKDVEEGVAVLAAFADQGLKGVSAGDALSIVFRDLQTKALSNASAFKQFNVGVFDSAGEMRNAADIIGDLEGALGGMSDAQKKATLLQLGFTDKSVSMVQTLLGTSDKIREYETALRSAGGTTAEVAAKQMTPFGAAINKVRAMWEAFAIKVGTPILNGLATAISQFVIPGLQKFGTVLSFAKDIAVSAFAKVRDALNSTAFKFTAMSLLAGGAIVGLAGSVLWLAGAVKTALVASFAALLSPMGLVIGGALLLGGAFILATGEGETFGEKVNSVFNSIPGAIEGVMVAFRNFGDTAQLAIVNVGLTALQTFPQIQQPIQDLAAGFVGAFAGVKAFFSAFVQNIIGGLTEIKNVLQAVFSGATAAFNAVKSGDFKGAAGAFSDAFTKQLASQMGPQSAGSPFKAFNDAFQSAANEISTGFDQSGGLTGMLEGQKKSLLQSIEEREDALLASNNAIKNAAQSSDPLTTQLEMLKQQFALSQEQSSLAQQTQDELNKVTLAQKAQSIFAETRTPLEQMQSKVAELQELFDAGLLDSDTFNRALTKAGEQLGGPADKFGAGAQEKLTPALFNSREAMNRQLASSISGKGGPADKALKHQEQTAQSAKQLNEQIAELIAINKKIAEDGGIDVASI